MFGVLIPRRDDCRGDRILRRVLWAVIVVLGLAASAPVMAYALWSGAQTCGIQNNQVYSGT